ncbi:MAG: PAS domain-containing protein [Alphaproteobacteria bacterium]|nr:PAS domain-containing protein [Alphaproteobacteria bacterium]MBU1526588.1 PAS domain-containing protein [Alphaproteobacteria bacterium]MBU2118152.1 PAS domain-containing protein [Alphaproteobacteria bacterium]MBU2351557.1 PAS domain-containing protein [Alphaproteobacteria bacterium]MBU2383164.1 PAS domain-containing protein [Alphaproteobacteria bacterium]
MQKKFQTRGNPEEPRTLCRPHAGGVLKHLELSGELARDIALAFDASPNPYMLLTPAFRYAGMNQAYLDVLGRRREDLIGRDIFELYDGGTDATAESNARRLRESLERVVATGERDHLPLIHYPIAVIDPDGSSRIEDRWWSATHSPVRNAAGEVVYILQHTQDVTEVERLRRRAAGDADRTIVESLLGGNILARAEHVQADNRRLQSERNRLLDIFLQAPGFIAVLTGPDHVFQMHNRAYAQLVGRGDLDGKPLRAALPEIPDQGFLNLLDEVRTSGQPFEGRAVPVQLARTGSGALETVYLDFIYQPLRDSDGSVAGVFVQGHDVTDAVLADRRQRLMIDELNHRVKNTLATVQSIAMQTARAHAEPERFAERFQARLMALSHTHDLLTRSHWEGADLHDTLQHETAAHGVARVLLNGPVVGLKPSAALSLGMIFHELATNAAKYGALSVPDGRVTVDWTRGPDGLMTVTWRETGGPPSAPPQRKGFGSRLIERAVRHDLAGDLTTDYGDQGLVAVMRFPVDSGRG